MNTFAEPTAPMRPNASVLGHARNHTKRYGQVLDTSAEFLTTFPALEEPCTPPPLSPSHSSTSSSGHSSPTLSSGPATPSPNAALNLDSDSDASFPFLRYSPPEVLIHVAGGEEGATLEEVRAMGAFWRSLGGDELDGAALLADAPGDKYRSLIAALDTPPPQPTSEDDTIGTSAGLPLAEWEDDIPQVETSFESVNTSCSCDAISQVLAELEADTPMTGALAELSQIEDMPLAESSPARPLRRRPDSGRASATPQVGFSAWIDVDAPAPGHTRSGKLVKDQQSIGHHRKLSAAISVPDLKARARSLGRKTSLLFMPSKRDSSEPGLISPASTVPSVTEESITPMADEAPIAGPSRSPAQRALPLSPIEEDDLDTSSALDRLELSLAKLDLSVHHSSSPSSESTRPLSPVQWPIRSPTPTASRPTPVLRAKQSLPAIAWETYDPRTALSATHQALTEVDTHPHFATSTSAPSGLAQWSLDFDPFAIPYATAPLSPKSATSFRPAALSIVTSLASSSDRRTPSPTSPFVVVPAVPPLWAIDELPSAPAPLAPVPEESAVKNGLLKKAVRKAGMVGWWGKQKVESPS